MTAESHDEAIAEALAKAVYFAETIIHHDHEAHWRDAKRLNRNLWRDVGNAVLAEARRLAIIPTGGAFTAGMRKAAEMLIAVDLEFDAAEKKAGRPTHDESGRPVSISAPSPVSPTPRARKEPDAMTEQKYDAMTCPCRRCDDARRNAAITAREAAKESFADLWLTSKFIVCPTCGNKRCPHASNHIFPCTGSNAPGQKGSDYE